MYKAVHSACVVCLHVLVDGMTGDQGISALFKGWGFAVGERKNVKVHTGPHIPLVACSTTRGQLRSARSLEMCMQLLIT
jgi:hypothetical protein